MARGRAGGRSVGSHSHRYGGGSGGCKDEGGQLQASTDALALTNSPPLSINGSYTLSGNQMSICNHLNNFQQFKNNLMNPNAMINQINPINLDNTHMGINMDLMPIGNPMINPMVNPIINPINPIISGAFVQVQNAQISVAGNKTAAANSCCFFLTNFLGALLIFPLILMCFTWWKKIVFPFYEINVQTYRNIARFLAISGISNLKLTVVDNAFNAQKAQILYQAVAQSRLTAFIFTNNALYCNYQGNQASQFNNNMSRFKQLPFPSLIKWRDTIL